MKKVIIESPFAIDTKRNEIYLNRCLADSLERGEAPFASHGLYTRPGVLDDSKHAERMKGIHAGFAWRESADITAFYIDLGFSEGMGEGLFDVIKKGLPFEFRTIFSRQNHEQNARIIMQAIVNAHIKRVSEV